MELLSIMHFDMGIPKVVQHCRRCRDINYQSLHPGVGRWGKVASKTSARILKCDFCFQSWFRRLGPGHKLIFQGIRLYQQYQLKSRRHLDKELTFSSTTASAPLSSP